MIALKLCLVTFVSRGRFHSNLKTVEILLSGLRQAQVLALHLTEISLFYNCNPVFYACTHDECVALLQISCWCVPVPLKVCLAPLVAVGPSGSFSRVWEKPF